MLDQLRPVLWVLLVASAVGLLSCQSLGIDGLGADGVRVYPDPPAAGEALVAALRADDAVALGDILGKDAEALLVSGDEVSDETERARFVRLYDADHRWVSSGAGAAVLEIGARAWPFPVPLVRSGEGWAFALDQGADELLNRRIGRNELAAIQACLAFVDAEREYYDWNPRGLPTPEYARFLMSRGGEKNGLYWETGAGEEPSPLGSVFAAATEAGYALEVGGRRPFHGYSFRVLDAQGEDAPGGAMDYVVEGAMTQGFALLAWPARYGASGVMTFVINQVGVLYEKDLGPDTASAARAIARFDPGSSWAIVADQALVPPGS